MPGKRYQYGKDIGAMSSTTIKVLDGNRAAAYAVMSCRPDVVAMYPITPSTQVVESLWEFQAKGMVDAEMIQPESEHAVMAVLRGASAAGARTFTVTCSQGLAFMFENCFHVASNRLPVVMVDACRELEAPHSISRGQQDAMALRDSGWIQIHAASCQEILDSIIMAYRLAEDPEIRIPVMVCYDGYYLSHLWQPVEIPSQEKVDQFLPPLEMNPRIAPDTRKAFCNVSRLRLATEYRYKQTAAMMRAKGKIEDIDSQFEQIFGRNYGGQIEEYRTEDADVVLIALGSSASTAKVAVDEKRDQGLKVGLVRIRMFRPFPRERLASALNGKKAVGVLDLSLSFGWGSGPLFIDSKAVLSDLSASIPMADFIGGLYSQDVTIEHLKRAIDVTNLAAQGGAYEEVTWLDLEEIR